MKVVSVKHGKKETVYDIETPVHDYVLENGVISHNTMDQYNPAAMGGSGLKYAASTILFLSKRKERDAERNVIGNVIHVKAEKSRLTREQMKVDTRLFFDTGLDRYYGLVDLAIGAGIWKKVSTRVETEDGKKVFQSVIERNPEEYFNETVLNAIDEYCKKKFCFGKREDLEEELDELGEVDDNE